jgi:hypothetical protein
VAFQGEVLPGEQPAIVNRRLFEAVQAKLDARLINHKSTKSKSEALLLGKIFDDRGSRMTPSHARKRGVKYRYYISAKLTQALPDQAGSIGRVPANEVETIVAKAARTHFSKPGSKDDASLIRDHVVRVEVRSDRLVIELSEKAARHTNRKGRHRRIEVPWHKPPSKRRREILIPEDSIPESHRPIRSESRALLICAIAQGRRWLDELVSRPGATVDSIARRERCSVRKVNMTLSLAFLAPSLVKAVIERRLPRGIGVTRLSDLPPEWSRQYRALGLTPP